MAKTKSGKVKLTFGYYKSNSKQTVSFRGKRKTTTMTSVSGLVKAGYHKDSRAIYASRKYTDSLTKQVGQYGIKMVKGHKNGANVERSVKYVQEYIRKASTEVLKELQKFAMNKALQVYREKGFEEHELTGNTRASIQSVTYTNGRSGIGPKDVFLGMDDTPRPNYNVLPSTYGLGGPRVRYRTSSRGDRKWRYFLIKQYKTGKLIRWFVDEDRLVDTGIKGKADAASKAALTRMRMSAVRGSKTKHYALGVVAMNPTYIAELADVMFAVQRYMTDLLHDFLEARLMESGSLEKVLRISFAEAMGYRDTSGNMIKDNPSMQGTIN